MNIVSTAKAAVAGVATAGALALATPTEAATIIQTFGQSVLNPDRTGKGTFDVATFNNAAGTLNSVTITLAPSVETAFGNPNPTKGSALFTMRGFVNISSTDANAPVFENWEGISTGVQNTLNPYYAFSDTPPVQVTTLTSASDLAKFIGSGSYHYNIESGMEVLSSSGTPYDAIINNKSRPYITITYDFTEATVPPVSAVPEPGTWGMMITGFALAGAALRRSRKAANDAAPAPTV